MADLNVTEALATQAEVVDAIAATVPTAPFEPSVATLDSGKMNFNLPAIGVGILIGGAAIGGGYLIYRLIKKAKSKKEEVTPNAEGN